MIRDATPLDLPAILAFLTAQSDQAMFPLASLHTHGLTEGAFSGPHDHALRIWLIGRSVLALTRAGNLLPYLDGTPDLSGLPAALRGQSVAGVIGPATSARPVIAALGLSGLPTDTDRDEPGFALNLVDLEIPHLPDTALRPLTPEDLPLAIGWRETYIGEVLGTFGPDARAKAEAEIPVYMAQDSHRLLLHEGRPVAMTGFNAILPRIVQIGGVYTPAPLRGTGYARRAVALHLAEARAGGATRAVLFAASDAAARAYQALGFQRAQDFTLFLLSTSIRLPA